MPAGTTTRTIHEILEIPPRRVLSVVRCPRRFVHHLNEVKISTIPLRVVVCAHLHAAQERVCTCANATCKRQFPSLSSHGPRGCQHTTLPCAHLSAFPPYTRGRHSRPRSDLRQNLRLKSTANARRDVGDNVGNLGVGSRRHGVEESRLTFPPRRCKHACAHLPDLPCTRLRARAARISGFCQWVYTCRLVHGIRE